MDREDGTGRPRDDALGHRRMLLGARAMAPEHEKIDRKPRREVEQDRHERSGRDAGLDREALRQAVHQRTQTALDVARGLPCIAMDACRSQAQVRPGATEVTLWCRTSQAPKPRRSPRPRPPDRQSGEIDGAQHVFGCCMGCRSLLGRLAGQTQPAREDAITAAKHARRRFRQRRRPRGCVAPPHCSQLHRCRRRCARARRVAAIAARSRSSRRTSNWVVVSYCASSSASGSTLLPSERSSASVRTTVARSWRR